MKISEIFYSIQGEGKRAGVPSVFVRTSGCNLRCTWCDTPYASWQPEGQELSVVQIVEQVQQHNAHDVVLTGGEPVIAPEINQLARQLKDTGHFITLETAATVFEPLAIDLASLSPKLSNSTPHDREDGRFAIAHENNRLNLDAIQKFIDQSPDFQLKFVVSGQQNLLEIDEILRQVKNWTPADILLMPEGIDTPALNAKTSWIIDICKSRGFRFCPRLHIALFGNRRGT
jgi:7-carboxy-7-deazaguanine synthase